VELELFKLSVFLALLSYGLVPFLAYYQRHLKDWGSETLFAMEEVVLEVGELSDNSNVSCDELLKEREFTGRQRLARHWHMFARKGETRVAADDMFTERLLTKRKQAFKELDKDGNGFLTKDELQTHRDWLEKLEKIVKDAHSWYSTSQSIALQMQGIQKEDIDQLLEEKSDVDGDGRISFAEFLHVRAAPLSLALGEAVQVKASKGGYTAAEIVRQEEDGFYYVRTFAFRAWQPSWLLAKLLVDGMMLPALVVAAAQKLVVTLKNSVRRGYKQAGPKRYAKDEDYNGSMVFMGKEEKAMHVFCKTKYIWLWQCVPFVKPMQKVNRVFDYSFVTTSTIEQFVHANPGVKTIDLANCRNMGTEGLDAIGNNCRALKALIVLSCGLPALPPSLAQLSSLEDLRLGDNEQLGNTAVEWICSNLAHLKTLIMPNTGLTALPPSLAQLSSLKVLRIHENGLTALPSSLAQLSSLEELWVADNKKLGYAGPEWIGCLPMRLSELRMWNINLSSADKRAAKNMLMTQGRMGVLYRGYI
jgi:Ca2+-binding EF-hand superfamily protein